MIPNDIAMLVSLLNTKLRDDDMSLEMVVEVLGGSYQEVMDKLNKENYMYDQKLNQIKNIS